MDWGATDPTSEQDGVRETPETARSEGNGNGFTRSGGGSGGSPIRADAGLRDTGGTRAPKGEVRWGGVAPDGEPPQVDEAVPRGRGAGAAKLAQAPLCVAPAAAAGKKGGLAPQVMLPCGAT